MNNEPDVTVAYGLKLQTYTLYLHDLVPKILKTRHESLTTCMSVVFSVHRKVSFTSNPLYCDINSILVT